MSATASDSKWKVVVAIVGGAVFGFILAASTRGFGTTKLDGDVLADSTSSGNVVETTQKQRIETFKRVAPAVVINAHLVRPVVGAFGLTDHFNMGHVIRSDGRK